MTITIDTSEWRRLNLWRHPGGDLAVRPGLRRIYTPAFFTELVAAFSVRDDFLGAGNLSHYVVTKHPTNGVHVLVLDENFDVFQDLAWGDADPRTVTCAIVDQQMMINSPDLPPLFGMVGTGLIFATAVASDTTDTVINPPSGIVLSICNRVAVASGRLVYFSDPVAIDGGDIRSFVGFNVNGRTGIIYGLHEGAGGMLVAVTSDGTYGLDADAFAVGQVGFNGTAWRLLSHVSAHSYDSSCVHGGRVYVLTESGWTIADQPTSDEMELADPTMARARGPSISLPDFRRCRMYSADAGPVVAVPQLGAMYRADLMHDMGGWWRDQTANPGDLRGIIRDHDGSEMWVMSDGIYRIGGDFDGSITLQGADLLSQPVGVLYGVVQTSANENALPRKINVAAAVDGPELIYASVRGSEHTSDEIDPDAFGVEIGSAWGEDGRRWTTTPVANAQLEFGDVEDTDATRDVGIEVGASGCLTRLSEMPTIKMSDSARKRPQAGG